MNRGATAALAQDSRAADACALSRLDGADLWLSLFENSSLGIAVADPAFRFMAANPSLLTMLGYTSEELQELSFFEICVEEGRDACRGPLQEMREGVRAEYGVETHYCRRDGTTVPVTTYFSAVGGRTSKPQAFLAVTIDNTVRGAAEEALHAARSELARVARLTTVGAMAGSIAHEVNQPLTSIVSNGSAGLRWLDHSQPNLEEARSAFKRIVSEGHRASQIVTGIRAMFRKESGDRALVAINEIVCEVVSIVLGELKRRRISLSLGLLDDLPPVLGDRVQLQQLLLNLFTNAMDSMGAVADRAHTLNISSEQLENWVLVSVQDSGTGIDPEQIERMFEAFHTTKPNGIGLGLSIGRSIVESHGGRLSASAARPFGSVFQVMLPAHSPGNQ
jgi:PAS domain S-box-containing protein